MEEIFTISCGNANVYLITGPDGRSILIDTGTERYREKVLKQCAARKMTLIFLTHGHFDHCQNVAYLARALNCPVGIGAEDIPLVQAGVKRSVCGCGIWGQCYAAASNWNIRHQKIPAFQPTVTLSDGMSLSEYGIDGQVIALPGHTQGSVGALLNSGSLFVGDAMQSIPRPAASWCFEDREAMERSVSAIRQRGVSRIYCGHGRAPRGT